MWKAHCRRNEMKYAIANRCKTPGIRKVDQEASRSWIRKTSKTFFYSLLWLMIKAPIANKISVRRTTLYAILRELVFFFIKLSTDKVILTPIRNINHGNTRSATVSPDKNFCWLFDEFQKIFSSLLEIDLIKKQIVVGFLNKIKFQIFKMI